MTNTESFVVKHWPRISAGTIAIGRLIIDPMAVFLAFRHQDQVRQYFPCTQDGHYSPPPSYFGEYHSHPSQPGMCLSDEQERIVKGFVITTAVLTTLFHGVTLYAVIAKSMSATKVSLKVWCSQMGCLVLTYLLKCFGGTRQAMDYLNQWHVFRFQQYSLTENLVFGLALLLILRDLRVQAARTYGSSQEDDEVLEVLIEKEKPLTENY